MTTKHNAKDKQHQLPNPGDAFHTVIPELCGLPISVTSVLRCTQSFSLQKNCQERNLITLLSCTRFYGVFKTGKLNIYFKFFFTYCWHRRGTHAPCCTRPWPKPPSDLHGSTNASLHMFWCKNSPDSLQQEDGAEEAVCRRKPGQRPKVWTFFRALSHPLKAFIKKNHFVNVLALSQWPFFTG